jgi:hypothetical protein
MNVTVVGSFRKGQNQRLKGSKKDFVTACEGLGSMLARRQHRLIVPHPETEDTAEGHALRGFRQIAGQRHYYCCPGQAGDPALKAHFDAVEKSDAVVLIGGRDGTYAAGLSALRRRKLMLPIPVFGGSAKDLLGIPDIDNILDDEIRNLDLDASDWADVLVNSVDRSLRAFPKVLIVHGRGDSGLELRRRISRSSEEGASRLSGIAEPIIMNLSGMGAISVPSVFEELASQVSAAIAVVTADDVGGFARGDGRDYYPASELRLDARARENVWVEVGWFWGRLGRQRVFLWLKEKIALPSDLQGAAWTSAETMDDAWASIEAFLSQLRNPRDSQTARPAEQPVAADGAGRRR